MLPKLGFKYNWKPFQANLVETLLVLLTSVFKLETDLEWKIWIQIQTLPKFEDIWSWGFGLSLESKGYLLVVHAAGQSLGSGSPSSLFPEAKLH